MKFKLVLDFYKHTYSMCFHFMVMNMLDSYSISTTYTSYSWLSLMLLFAQFPSEISTTLFIYFCMCGFIL